MIKWEYHVISTQLWSTHTEFNGYINGEGEEGWEAVCVLPGPPQDSLQILMKRQKQSN